MIQNRQAFDGTIVITDNQFAGRGQRGNAWEATPGQNLTFSVVLKPSFLQPLHQFSLNMAVSLAIQDFLKNEGVMNARIKWPNDVFVGNHKMGGVLIENQLSGNKIKYSIIGIGLNINQLEFENKQATSLRFVQKKEEFDLTKLLEKLCSYLEKWYFFLKENHAKKLKELYVTELFRYNEIHRFWANNEILEGKIIDVNDYGKIKIEANNVVQEFDFKEVAFLDLGS